MANSLPTVKSLQAEYAVLLEEKKKAYAEYRRSREEMRELLTVKANVDRLLNIFLVKRSPYRYYKSDNCDTMNKYKSQYSGYSAR